MLRAEVQRRGIKIQVKNQPKRDQGRLVTNHLRRALDDGVNILRRRARRAAGQYGLMDNERDERDNYETPDEAVDHLLSNVTLTGVMWDPSCGRGKIVKALIHAGQRAHGSDKFVYVPIDGMRTQVKYGYDFIGCLGTTDSIIMNPPFDQSDDHVRHALKIIPSDGKVCVLLRLTWIAAQKRADLLKHLHKIIICGRLKMLPPGVPDQGHSGAVDFAWFVFGHRVVNATQIVRVR